jgi:2-amino-4-hydroxy-6-hydroxymethyldihydropteridine diphosphokinase
VTRAAVGFGANLGAPAEAFAAALAALEAAGARAVARSSLWRSAPWGVEDQPDFLNGVALVEVGGGAAELLARLRQIEVEGGREPGLRWGPRVLDLDLLWFGDAVLEEGGLAVPHPRLAERSFVLEPAVEVAPDWRHPSGRTVLELRDALREGHAWTACLRVPDSRLGDPVPEAACRP